MGKVFFSCFTLLPCERVPIRPEVQGPPPPDMAAEERGIATSQWRQGRADLEVGCRKESAVLRAIASEMILQEALAFGLGIDNNINDNSYH